MVETADLERQWPLSGPAGSNPAPSALNEDAEYDALPSRLGMCRDEDTVGFEKRRGGFAGDAGRRHMKTRSGR